MLITKKAFNSFNSHSEIRSGKEKITKMTPFVVFCIVFSAITLTVDGFCCESYDPDHPEVKHCKLVDNDP